LPLLLPPTSLPPTLYPPPPIPVTPGYSELELEAVWAAEGGEDKEIIELAPTRTREVVLSPAAAFVARTLLCPPEEEWGRADEVVGVMGLDW
jgi:hypothetical protein